jgi:hypothetical protein
MVFVEEPPISPKTISRHVPQTVFDKCAKHADLGRWLALPLLEHGTA